VTKHSTQQGLYVLDLDPCIHSYIPHGHLVATDLQVALSRAELLELAGVLSYSVLWRRI